MEENKMEKEIRILKDKNEKLTKLVDDLRESNCKTQKLYADLLDDYLTLMTETL